MTHEWGSMAKRQMTLAPLPTHLIEGLKVTLAVNPADESQKTAQREIINELRRALDARRQRIVVSKVLTIVKPGKGRCARLMVNCKADKETASARSFFHASRTLE
jgi:hypothetical protein